MLVQCPECGNEVSSKASDCPHCGYPLSARPESNAQKENIGCLGGVTGCGCLTMYVFFIILGLILLLS